MKLTPRPRWVVVAIVGIGALALSAVVGSAAQGADTSTSFTMVRSAVAVNADCVPNAGADVRIVSHGTTETMTLRVHGLPKNTDVDFFVIQVPTVPLGMSWYQGDIETNDNGVGTGTFIGRFSVDVADAAAASRRTALRRRSTGRTPPACRCSAPAPSVTPTDRCAASH